MGEISRSFPKRKVIFTHVHVDDEDQGSVYVHASVLHENGDVNEF
jgi:hypothetical protein